MADRRTLSRNWRRRSVGGCTKTAMSRIKMFSSNTGGRKGVTTSCLRWPHLVNRRVAVIASTGGPDVVEAAAAATTTVPIVFLGSDSVLKTGVITSLNRPIGNVTGVVMSVTALLSKCLQFLDELVMKDRAIAVLL